MERLSMLVYPSFFRGSTLHGGGAHLEEEGAFVILHLLIRGGGLVRSG
jgi:hypothetical protein